MKPVAWITGAGGLVGSYLERTASRWAPDWDVRGLTRQDVDLTDETAVRRLWREHQPAAVIHCASISRPAVCERDPGLARKVNVEATALLAPLASEVPLLFFSSDQVFDGRQGRYGEADRINPINRYGETKAAAEEIVLSNPRHTVIRLALTAGTSLTNDRSFGRHAAKRRTGSTPHAIYRRVSQSGAGGSRRARDLGADRPEAIRALSSGRSRTAVPNGDR